MSNEEIKEQLEWSDHHEFSYNYAIWAFEEIDRLNNLINGLEEYIKPYLYMLNGIQDRDIYEQCQLDDFTDIMEKLQELKENNK
jgi:hypothetical protein